MRRLLALLLATVALGLAPGGAYGHGGSESSSTQMPAQALAVQALAMLDAHMGAADARASLDAALRATDKADIRLERLRAADAALARNDTIGARRELDAAFNPDDSHLIGTSFSAGGDIRTAAAVLGGILLAGSLLLYRRTRSLA